MGGCRIFYLVRAWQRTYGLPTLVTNCFNNYGPFHFPEKLIPHVILNALYRKPLPIYGDGQPSPTFGKWVGETLSADNKRMMWVPEEFAHGFLVVSDTAEFLYSQRIIGILSMRDALFGMTLI